MHFGGVHALNGVTFEAEPGAIVGLIGANGSGKTTTLDVVSGLVTPQAGTVRMDGIDLAEYLPEERLGAGWSAPSRTAASTPSSACSTCCSSPRTPARRSQCSRPRSASRGPGGPSGASSPRWTR